MAVRECARRMRVHIKKRKKLKKIKEKYSIIQQILPEIARKSSEIVGLPLPDIAKVVTSIMNVVVVDDRVVYEKVGDREPASIPTPSSITKGGQAALDRFMDEPTPPEEDVKPTSPWITKSYVTVTNYTPRKKSITIYAKIPQCEVSNVIPAPRKIGDGIIIWDLESIEPTASELLCFDITDLDKGDFDNNEIFFSGAKGEVIGAEKMHF